MPKRASFVAFVCALAFLCFTAGAWLATFKLFPHSIITRIHLGGKAAAALLLRRDDGRYTKTWNKQRSPRRGLVRHLPDSVSEGYTLYTSSHDQLAFLLAMDGRVVHRWHIPYGDYWKPSADIPRRPDERYVYWRKARLMPNGDLVVIVVEAGTTPWGLGLIRIDRDSRIVWKYLKRAHHDFCIDEQGRVYVLTQRIRTRPLGDLTNIQAPFVEDLLTVLSPAGEELWSVSVYEALKKSHWTVMYRAPADERGDYLHTNAVALVSPAQARVCPVVRAGHLLISMRDLDLIGTLDPESRSFSWVAKGAWIRQHDPDILDNGNILMFDNLGRFNRPGGRSRVMEVDPVTNETVWCFEGSDQDEFCSEVRGSQQRLPNGNTLITESDGGRILEVTRGKTVVWEYVNPARNNSDSTLVAAVCGAERIAAEWFDKGFPRSAVQ